MRLYSIVEAGERFCSLFCVPTKRGELGWKVQEIIYGEGWDGCEKFLWKLCMHRGWDIASVSPACRSTVTIGRLSPVQTVSAD